MFYDCIIPQYHFLSRRDSYYIFATSRHLQIVVNVNKEQKEGTPTWFGSFLSITSFKQIVPLGWILRLAFHIALP